MDRYLVSAKDAGTGVLSPIQINRSGRLKGAQIAFNLDSVVDNTENLLQLSLVANPPEILAGDQAQVLSQILAVLWNQANFATSGLAISGQSVFIPMDEPVSAGQFLYVMHELLGTGTGNYSVIWFVQPGK